MVINRVLFIFQKGILSDKGGDTAVVETVVEPLSAPEKASSKQPTFKVEKKAEKVAATTVQQEQVKVEKKAEKAAATTVQQEQATPPPPSKERNRKKRSELATLQQMSEYSLLILHEDYLNVQLLR
jgi:hypothetical protein